MAFTETYTHNIHFALKELLANKSKRDHINFTVYQLAKALNMPHSILLRLIHADPSKRVNNPRVDTLIRIVDFFRSDGFDVTIDDLLAGLRSKTVDVCAQDLGLFKVMKTVPVYSLDLTHSDWVGTMDVKLTEDAKNVVALLSNEDIKPMFKKGSVFIIDTELKPEDDTLVAAKIEGYKNILIRKFHIKTHQILLKSYDKKVEPIVLMPTLSYLILGVVIQVNAKI